MSMKNENFMENRQNTVGHLQFENLFKRQFSLNDIQKQKKFYYLYCECLQLEQHEFFVILFLSNAKLF